MLPKLASIPAAQTRPPTEAAFQCVHMIMQITPKLMSTVTEPMANKIQSGIVFSLWTAK